jgi:transposase-like protein
MLERNGNLITRVVDNTQQSTIGPIIKSNIKQGSNVYTDDWYRHSNLSQNFNHQMVNHGIKEYVREKIHTNSIEGFWSHLKRTIYGNYHQISRKHMQNYLNEIAMRYNTRKYKEQERFDLILASTVGKRLTYQRLIS